MSRLCTAFFVIAVWLIFPGILGAQRGIGMGGASSGSDARTLSGTVYYPGNKAADHITVELHSTEGSMIYPATTTASGGYEFHNLASSTYALVINEQGYQPVELPVDLNLTSNRGIVIYLTPIEGKSASPAPHSTVSAHELSMPQKARDSMDTGKKKLYGDKNAQGALQDFHQAVAAAPDYYEAYYQIGKAYQTLNNRDEAEKSFRKSVDVSGDKYGEADVSVGSLMVDKGDLAGGEKTIRRGIELLPNYWPGYYELGRAQMNAKQFEDARKSAEQARSLAPNSAMIYRLLSNIHLQLKDYPALLEDLDAYVKLDPDSPAGTRAKQMREQVQQKIAQEKPPAAAPDAKP
jgi:tetratricopeptide (TPR) repeat protein